MLRDDKKPNEKQPLLSGGQELRNVVAPTYSSTSATPSYPSIQPQLFVPPPSFPTTAALQPATKTTTEDAGLKMVADEHLGGNYKIISSAVISANEELSNLKISDIIRKSTLAHRDPAQVIRNIVNEFNQGNPESFVVESDIIGTRIDANQFMLVHKNNVPQLIAPTSKKIRLGIYPVDTIEMMEIADQTKLVIGAHGRYVVNVPQGKFIKAWLGTDKPIILGPGPHVIRHPNFKLDANPEANISDNYITHGNYHIVRVPRGKLAKISIAGTPYLLEYSPEPYILNDPTFVLHRTRLDDNSYQYFLDASDRLITHGSIKRVLPRNEVAIAYDHGELQIIQPTGKPIIKDNPAFFVDGFLQTVAQTLVFPSEKSQEERRRANPKDLDAITYEKFRTSDGLEVGVKLLVVYEIVKPDVTLKRLNKNDIINHIENIVVADMGRVIQSCSSADFQKSNQTAVKDATKPDFDAAIFQPANTTFFTHLQDEVKNQLAKDLVDWGIRLVRLNIETPEILSKTIASEMSQNALSTAKKRAEASTLSIEYEIKKRHAEQEAEKTRIEVERQRANLIVDAEGKAQARQIEAQSLLEAAKLKAQAVKIEYEATMNNERMKNDTAIKLKQMENEAAVQRIQMENQAKLDMMQKEFDMKVRYLEQTAKVYGSNEAFRQYETTKAQAEALKGVSTSVISPEVAQTWYASAQGIGFFSGLRNAAVTRLPSPPKQREGQDKAPEVAAVLKPTGSK